MSKVPAKNIFASLVRPSARQFALTKPLQMRHSLQPLRLRSSPYSSSAPSPPKYQFTPAKTKSELLRPTTILLILVPIFTGFLGVWQLKRLRWKLDLIDEVDRNLEKPPMLLPNHINLDALPDFSFRRVLVKGHFTGPPILLGPQTYDGFPGYHLILPFVRSSGSTILVNRGFITTTRANAIRAGTQCPPGLTPDGGPTEEEVVIEGLLPKQGEQSTWAPDNNVEKNEWFWKDVEGMAAVAGGEEKGIQPVLVDVIAEPDQSATMLMHQGIPVGRPAQVELRNQHAQYAGIWLSLSASTTCMIIYILTRKKAGPKPMRPKLY